MIGRGHENEPLVDYALFVSTFLALTTAAVARATATGRAPERVAIADIVLLGLASSRFSRLVTREKATRIVRAPFTEVDPGASPHEVKETPRRGPRQAIGELLTCPRCVGMWSSAALTLGCVFAPGPTRLVAAILAVSAMSDVVNAYRANATAAPT